MTYLELELADSIIDNPSSASNNLKQQYFKRKKDWVETPISEEDYIRFATRLAGANVDYDKVLGYLATTPNHHLVYCKYNKKTENFVVYFYHESVSTIVTFFKKSWREYEGEKWADYYDEIPSGK